MRFLLTFLSLLAPCFGQISYDTGIDSGQAPGFAASITQPYTTGCANALVIARISSEPSATVPTITINGISPTAVAAPYQNPNSATLYDQVFYTVIASPSTFNVVVTNPGTLNQYYTLQTVDYCGALGTVEAFAQGAAINGPFTTSVTTSLNHDWLVYLVVGLNGISAGTGTTARLSNNTNIEFKNFIGDSNSSLSPPGSYSLTANIVGASVPWSWLLAIPPAVSLPSLTTGTAGSITNASAIITASNVTNDGQGTVTARGACWGTAPHPTLMSGTCISAGSGTGLFNSHLTGMPAVTLIYVAAYATNSAGTAYGSDVTLTTNPTAVPTNVQVPYNQISNTQAVLTFDTPNGNICPLQVSTDPNFGSSVVDLDQTIFSGADQANRSGNTNVGYHWQFNIGKRDIELGNVGANTGHYFSRALEAATVHYYSLNCPGGVVTGSFTTKPPPLGNTFAEPFNADPSTPGSTPYPYLDPTVRNSFYIDPQTGLRHTALTFPSDQWANYTGQAYTDAADMNGATWSNPTNVYMSGMPTTATTGTGNLWIGVRNTAVTAYDFITGPSYDYLNEAGSNGSISFYQPTLTASVSSGTDVLVWCLTVDHATCATTSQTLNINSTPTTYGLGNFHTFPNGTNGGLGADPLLFNATPPINRWYAYTHAGTVVSDGAGNLTWASERYFVDNWGSSSIIRLSTVDEGTACTSGTTYTIASLNSGTSLSVMGTPPVAGTFFYCANNFGVLIHRQTPDSRTVTLENAAFNITTSSGPIWFSASVIWSPSNVLLNGGYYSMIPSSTGPLWLYWINATTGQTVEIGPPRANSNSGTDGWAYFSQPGLDQYPFDDVASQSTGHLIFYENGVDLNGKQIILKTDLSGTPAYQLGGQSNPGNAAPPLMDPAGTITFPTAYSTQVVAHGMTAVFTNLTPASLGHDIATQFASVPGYSTPEFGAPYFAGVANGYIIYEAQGSGSKNTIAVYARINPATGLIDNTTTSYSQPNCRWCIDHSGAQMQGPSNYIAFGTDAVLVNPGSNGANGAGPWIVTTNTAVAAMPSVTCPSNSVGAPTTGTACDIFTLNSIGGAHPFEPYNPAPGPNESPNQYLQDSQPGDKFCVSAISTCSYFGSEIVVLVAKSGSSWTVWRPGNLNIANCEGLNPMNVQNAPPAQGNCWQAISGSASKNLFALCTGLGTGLDSNGKYEGSNQGGPTWDTTTSGMSATWYANLYFQGGHGDQKYNQTINGINVPGQTAEECLESIFCGITGTDHSADGYRLRTGTAPGILSQALSYTIATSTFAGVVGNDNTGFSGAGSSHLGVGGLANSFADDRPIYGDNLGITWTKVGGTNFTYVANSTISLSRKILQTGAVAGNQTLRDISGASSAISDSTPWTYCVVLIANECRSGSTVGQTYVSAPFRTLLGCYGGQNLVDIFGPGGNVVQDICVFPSGNNVNSIVQMGFTPDPVGWRYSTVLSFLANGKKGMGNGFANIRPLVNSSWALANEQWGSLFGTQVTAVHLPPANQTTDSISRSDFISLQISVPASARGNGVEVEFGYQENGSDGVSKFYCTTRQENCIANQSTVNDATPFYFASEAPTPLACTSGTCTVTIPALPTHTVFYRIKRTNSGTVIATGSVMTQVVQ